MTKIRACVKLERDYEELELERMKWTQAIDFGPQQYLYFFVVCIRERMCKCEEQVYIRIMEDLQSKFMLLYMCT